MRSIMLLISTCCLFTACQTDEVPGLSCGQPGTTQSCLCPDGTTPLQTCLEAGYWTACPCSNAADSNSNNLNPDANRTDLHTSDDMGHDLSPSEDLSWADSLDTELPGEDGSLDSGDLYPGDLNNQDGTSADSFIVDLAPDSQDSTPGLDLAETSDLEAPTEPLPVCINEFMAGNDDSLILEGDSPDWIELHNVTDEDLNLDGWWLSDSQETPDSHLLEGGLVVPAGGFLLLYADDMRFLGPEHLGFNLSTAGEEVVLTAPDGRQSILIYGELDDDVSAYRSTDCCYEADCFTYAYYGTPGESNVTPVSPELVPAVTEEILSAGNFWRYFDEGRLPAPNWHSPEYDDTAWPGGPAPLGYGDPHILTNIDYGEDDLNKYITAYFRQSFDVADIDGISALTVNLLRDDGAVVYLNGVEATRSNLPEGEIFYDTVSIYGVAASDETTFEAYSIDPSLLVEGENLLAVEVHQLSADSSDMGMDLNLSGSWSVETEAPPEEEEPEEEIAESPFIRVEVLPDYIPILPEPCAPIYDQETLTDIEFSITAQDWTSITEEYLYWSSILADDGTIKNYYPLTYLEINGEVVNDAEIRLKGNPCCSWYSDKMQFVIRFNGIDPEGRFQGMRKLALDGPEYDYSMLRDRLALSVFRDAGVAASCANNATLNVNGDFYGLYTNVEYMDEEFLQRNYGREGEATGTLFKYDYSIGEWEMKTNEETGVWYRFSTFHTPTVKNNVDLIDIMADIDQMLRFTAVEALLPAEDNYFSGSINFNWYDHPTEGFQLLPWDLDWSFNSESWSIYSPGYWFGGNDHFYTFLADTTTLDRYTEIAYEVLPAYDPVVLEQRLSNWMLQTEGAVALDPVMDTTNFYTEANRLRAFVYERRAYLETLLP